VRGGGGLLDGASGLGVGPQVKRPGTGHAPPRRPDDRHLRRRGSGGCGTGNGGVGAVTRFRGDDKEHVGGTLTDRATDPLGQLGGRVLGQLPVAVVRDRDRADAEDGGGQLSFPRPDRLEPRAAGVLPGGLAPGQAQQAQAGAGPAERVQQAAQVL
jgi:hypothetical protein